MRRITVKTAEDETLTPPRFYILDVFAEEKYAGNQLAVFRNTSKLSGSQMQKIANEMHFSETTFIQSETENNGGYDVRIFTPNTELPFAGHPTLGTAYVIRNKIIKQTIDTVNLNLKVGQISVTFERQADNSELVWMHQISPSFGKTHEAEDIAPVLNLRVTDIDDKYPIQEVSTGVPFLIVPLKTLAAVKRCHVNRSIEKNKKALSDFLVFCPETYKKENNLNVRVFVDLLGIPEDPATGSGNGCLAGYLVRYHYFKKESINVRVEQGYEINRPSLLHLKARDMNGEIEVYVGGKVFSIAEGELV